MTRRSRIAPTLGVVLAVAVAATSCSSGGGTRSGQVIPAADRQSVAPLQGTGLNGEAVDVAGLRGAPVVVNFWASWCGPCHAEQPDLERAQQATRSRGVHFVGINMRDPNAALARKFLDDFDVSYPSVVDDKLTQTINYRVAAPPATFVLDAAGRVAVRIPGQIPSAERLVTLIEQVAGEAA